MPKNRVLYGIKNVHIAKLVETDGQISYETPFPVEGAVGFSPEPQGEISVFYADNKIYFRKSTNNGYEGDLVVAITPEEFLTQILGRLKDTNGAIFESANDKEARFALMFEADGDEKGRRFVYYDCTSGRPTRENNTTEDTIEVGTDTLPITIAPRSTDEVIGAYLEPTEENKAQYDAFFTSVYEKNAAASV